MVELPWWAVSWLPLDVYAPSNHSRCGLHSTRLENPCPPPQPSSKQLRPKSIWPDAMLADIFSCCHYLSTDTTGASGGTIPVVVCTTKGLQPTTLHVPSQAGSQCRYRHVIDLFIGIFMWFKWLRWRVYISVPIPSPDINSFTSFHAFSD